MQLSGCHQLETWSILQKQSGYTFNFGTTSDFFYFAHVSHLYCVISCIQGCRIGRPRPGGSLVNSNSFNSVVNAATPFNPAQTNSLLDMQDIDLVATCSTNRYAKEMENAYTLTCTQFDDYGCKTQNDDLTPMLTERNGCRSDSYFPTVFPTGGFPTSFPTSFPSKFYM